MQQQLGTTLKHLRNQSEISVKEVSKFLCNKGHKASVQTIYSWENNNSQPSPDAFLDLCSLYKVHNILDTFGYQSKTGSCLPILSSEETHIKKYRALDEHGKKTVDFILDSEYERCNPKVEPEKSSGLIKFSDSYIPRELDGLAAHAIPGASQEDIEDDIKRVMEDAAKDRLHRKE